MIFHNPDANCSPVHKLEIRFSFNFNYYNDNEHCVVRLYVPAHLSEAEKFDKLLESLIKTGRVENNSWVNQNIDTDDNWIDLRANRDNLESFLWQLQMLVA